MRSSFRTLSAATAAAGLLVTGASAAQAAPTHKGTTTVAPSALTLSVLEGVTGPAKLTSAGAVFGIVGGTKGGVIKHVGGLTVKELDPTTAATSLTLSNFWIDTKAGTVSAIVDDTVRATVFTVDLGTGTLEFTAGASQAVTGSPTAIAGQVAGTATVKKA